ncbi:hypothetical protein [Xanthobacter pseudotagetidis]|uniref:hypothetical protein n=1 Tax=Xanthobacter pseudotagetidis TaxID=3119911 RepID=UPI00372CAC57
MGARDPVVERLAALKGELEAVGAELARRAADMEARARTGARQAAEDAYEAMRPTAEEAFRDARRAAAEFAAFAEEAEAKARATALAHPLALVAGCLLAGFVLGRIWRGR